jgi:two-component system, LytTR family, sensor kinase
MNLLPDRKRAVLYLLIGAAYLAFWLFSDLLTYPESWVPRAVNNIWLVLYLVVLNYVLFEFTIPFIRPTLKRIVATPFLLMAHIFLYSLGFYAWRFIGISIGLYTELRVHASIEAGTTYHFPYALFSIIFFGSIKYTYDYRKLKRAAQELRIQKQEAELNYLKSQTNPHFLFNTLNNIYSLARAKSDLAPESILRLSKILRFMLYDTSVDFIRVEQELKVIEDYIELEKLRYDETLRVNFSYDVEDMRQAVPPLLLVPLVENAFKHGVSETRTGAFVDVHLSIRNRMLRFVVRNSSENSAAGETVRENIGLPNLRRQLELLFTDYELRVKQEDRIFSANLTINLGSHV